MGRALLVLDGPADRQKAVNWIGKAPVGTRVEFKASKRSLPQNDLMWALLTEFAQQFEHSGKKYDPVQWKAIFLHAFGREVSFLPSLDGRTFLPIEMSTSDLSKQEMTDFIEFIIKEAAERGIVLHNPKENTESDAPPPASETDGDSPMSPPSDEESTGATPPSPVDLSITDAERSILIRYAHDVLPKAADSSIETKTLLSIEQRWWTSDLFKLSSLGQDMAREIGKSMRHVGREPDKIAIVIDEYAYRFGCTPEEIGGVS